ncbi:MAG: glycosyltransferase family A protein [Patescibacteria group bacterium]|nr:glycosyltransferase family A protein [Patescibacteria group bacterium]MDD5294846.1 glycosyltransferase family A protein [Patescibacteria group bacterium]MDD5554852.1 glycosyltransferase family A protein [Patescibacteria group bacterium]
MISIIIPIYNQADKLSKCLDSILAQTYKDYEVIIVNDGSMDNIKDVLENQKSKIKNKNHNVKLKIVNQENLGAPSARNRGFEESEGDFLFFCDADAVLIPEALETMLGALESHPEASFAYSSFLWGKKLFKVGPFSTEKLKAGPCIHTMSLIRREAFPKGGWDESIKKLQDWDLYLAMSENGRKGFWIDKVLFKIKPGGTISSWLPSFAYKLLPFLPTVKKYREAVKIIKNKHNLP